VNFETPKTRERTVIAARAKMAAQTGVEMEALSAVSMAGFTRCDIFKAVDKKLRISDVRLVSKIKTTIS
jgi:cyclic pyranopterin phosphate synthase